MLFLVLAVREARDLKNYLGYVVEHGKSALFHEESINQSIAARLSRAFYTSTVSAPITGTEREEICQFLEKEGDIYGLNLVAKKLTNFSGTLQTRNKSCETWAGDISALLVIHAAESAALSKYSFSNYAGYSFRNVRYYIDLTHNYIYINQQVNSRKYTFKNWLIRNDDAINIARSSHTISIDEKALSDLLKGESTLSHIYQDGNTHNNIISILTPVYIGDKVKGVLITDININDLMVSFKTVDRPLFWDFLSLSITDNETGSRIYFHRPYFKSYDIISRVGNLTGYNTLHVKLDAVYLFIKNSWLLAFYISGTWVLCRYARKQLIKHESLSRDNVTDAMTGLYNRKFITSILEQKISLFVDRKIPVTVIAIDSDGLKKINDSLGHHMGDKVIQTLGQALGNAIRKSDYGIRLGGDEFCLVLIDYSLNKARDVINRAHGYLLENDQNNLVAFSWGAYQLLPGDTLETGMLKADKLLYQHKRNKYDGR